MLDLWLIPYLATLLVFISPSGHARLPQMNQLTLMLNLTAGLLKKKEKFI